MNIDFYSALIGALITLCIIVLVWIFDLLYSEVKRIVYNRRIKKIDVSRYEIRAAPIMPGYEEHSYFQFIVLITEELLLKCGFRKIGEDRYRLERLLYSKDNHRVRILECNCDTEKEYTEVVYFSQLQEIAYKELNIKL